MLAENEQKPSRRASSPQLGHAQQSLPGVCVTLDELMRLGGASQGITFRSRQPAHSVLGGRHASRLRGRGLDFEELRAYQPGDDIRAMDWRVTARARSPFVRVYREEKERPVTLVCDQRVGMFFGSVKDMKSVTAARAAAVVAHSVVRGGDKISAVVFGDERIQTFGPERSQHQVQRILGCIRDHNRQLLDTPGASVVDRLDDALERVLRIVSQDHLIVLITDLVGAGERTKKLATELRRHNDLVLLWVHDPLEAELPDVGEVVLGDGAWQVQVDTAQPAVREKFAADVAARKQRAASFALHFDVPVLPLSTDRDVVAQLREQLERYGGGRRG